MKKLILFSLIASMSLTLAQASGGHSPTQKQTFLPEVVKSDVITINVAYTSVNDVQIFNLVVDYPAVTILNQTKENYFLAFAEIPKTPESEPLIRGKGNLNYFVLDDNILKPRSKNYTEKNCLSWCGESPR